MSADPAPASGAPPATPKKPWKGREPDEKDRAVLAVLHAARALIAPQLQLLYGLASPGSLQPRLVGLLGPQGTPRYLERAKAPDGRYVYALGPQGYDLLPGGQGEVVRHKPLGRLRISAQWLDHTLAVGWLQTTWLVGGGTLVEAGGHVAWWGERQATLRYPLPRPKEHVTHGRIEPDGAAVLVTADGQHWVGAVEHDQGTEDAEQWAAKLARWAAVVRCGAWAARCGDTLPHLLVTVPGPARLLQLTPWLAVGRRKHNQLYIWLAVHGDVALAEGEGIAVAAERLAARAWRQVLTGKEVAPERTLDAHIWTLPGIINATAPWRPPQEATAPPPSPPPASPPPPPPSTAAAARERDLVAEVAQLRHQLGEARAGNDMFVRRTRIDNGNLLDRAQRAEYALEHLENENWRGMTLFYALWESLPRVRLARWWRGRWWDEAAAAGALFALLGLGTALLLFLGLGAAALWETWRAADPTLAAAWREGIHVAWWTLVTWPPGLAGLGLVAALAVTGLAWWGGPGREELPVRPADPATIPPWPPPPGWLPK